MEVTTRTIIGFSFLLLGIIFLLKLAGIVEAFGVEEDSVEEDSVEEAAAARAKQGNYDIANQTTKCMANTSCSTCLDVAGCGWCPAAGKCIPKVNDYPIVPRAGSMDVTSNIRLNEPLFQCTSIEKPLFVSRKEQCADFQCDSLKSCRDCAGNAKCGWCGDSNKCLPKGAGGTLTVPAGTTCAAATAVTNSGNCPTRVCNTITDCVECASTPGCSFCEAAKKCVRFNAKAATTVNGVAVAAEAKDAPVDGCNEENAITSSTQCPSVRASQNQLSLDDGEPTSSEIASAQDNTVGGGGDNGLAFQGTPSTDDPVSTAQIFDMITAPGVALPIGSSSVRPSYPAAAGLDGTGPFETYVQMLVKSELAAQGVPTNEPFAMPSIVDTVRNATKEVKASMRKVFKPHMGVRI